MREKERRMHVIEWGWLRLARLADRLMDRLMDPLEGQSTVEYALVGALVVIVSATAMTILGSQISNVFHSISATLSGASSSAGH
jgi:Flp pilus assembly pilin Flp